ncbi:MAG: hypothetical protein ABSH08_04250 [Tepidisphaeraceae bacterium]|jgi:hypothetical protein
MSDPLEKLLHEADQRSLRPALNPADLSAAAWQTARRRERRAIGVAAVAAIGVSAFFWMALPHTRRLARQVVPQAPAIAQAISTDRELADLNARIAAQEKLVAHLDAVDRLQRANARLAQLHGDSDFNPLDEAAAVVVLEADRMRDAGLPAPAESAYEQVLKYFAATSWAEPVRERLDFLDKKG